MSIADAFSKITGGGKRPSISGSMGGDKPAPEQKPEGEESGAKSHLAAMHAEMGGKHFHAHSDGMSHTSHQVGEDGEVQGPHDHENLESLKQAMNEFLSEEEYEPSDDEPEEKSKGLL